MTVRRRARKQRTNREPVAQVLTRGALVLAVLGLFGYLSISIYSGVPGRDYEYAEALVPETGSLIPHDPVRIGGVRVGQVQEIGSDPVGRGKLTLQLKDGTDLASDTKIKLRANGLLGSRFVELIPGRSDRKLAPGTPIMGDADSLTFVVTDALDVFDEETRGALRPMFGELGKGLLGQGRNVNDALRRGAAAIPRFNVLMTRLLRQPEANAAFLPSLNSGLAPLSDNRGAIAEGFGVAADALRPFVAERAAARATLDAAPPALDAARSGLVRTRGLLGAVRGVSREARVTLPGAPGGLRATSALLRESPRPLRRAAELLDAVDPAVPAALRVTDAVRPLLPQLSELFGDLTPMSRQIGRYECDIENFGATFRSMTGFGTRNGEGPAGPAMQFRLQAIAPLPTTAVGTTEASGVGKREGLPEPCTYLSKPYPIPEREGSR